MDCLFKSRSANETVAVGVVSFDKFSALCCCRWISFFISVCFPSVLVGSFIDVE